MLRRAIKNARRHLLASTGADNGSAGASDDEGGFDVAYTSLGAEDAAREHFRKQPEDISGVKELLEALQSSHGQSKPGKRRISQVGDEDRRAANAWSRLQHLYGIFKELESDSDASTDTDSDFSDVESLPEALEQPETYSRRPRRRRDEGLRTLLQEKRVPHGVIMRDLEALVTTDASGNTGMPEGFTAGMFESLGDALYNEMRVAAQQNRISSEVLEELGDCLYAEAATLAVSTAA